MEYILQKCQFTPYYSHHYLDEANEAKFFDGGSIKVLLLISYKVYQNRQIISTHLRLQIYLFGIILRGTKKIVLRQP